jgi:hypothetical protein
MENAAGGGGVAGPEPAAAAEPAETTEPHRPLNSDRRKRSFPANICSTPAPRRLGIQERGPPACTVGCCGRDVRGPLGCGFAALGAYGRVNYKVL